MVLKTKTQTMPHSPLRTIGWQSLILLVFLTFLSFAHATTSLHDFFNRSLAIPTSPHRLISLSPATTESLYAIGAEKYVLAVTADCNYPPSAQSKPNVGRFGNIKLETLVRLKPDIILATRDMDRSLRLLKPIQVPLLALETTNVNGIMDNLLLLGQLTHREKQSHEVVQQMNKELNQIQQKFKKGSKKPTVFYLVWDQPLITASDRSFIGDVLKRSGADNIVRHVTTPFPHYNLEYLIRQDPDALIVPRSIYQRLNLKKAPFKHLKAVRHQRVLAIDDDLISRPAPRITQAIRQIADFLYQ